MDAFERLAEAFRKFPGIGGRQAQRFVYFLLQSEPEYVDEFLKSLAAVRQLVAQCSSCYRYFQKRQAAESPLCDICASPHSDIQTLLVVEKDVDLESMAKSGAYHGRYFVIGGTIPILEKDPASIIRSRELFAEVSRRAQAEGLKEVILALSATPEGDTTTAYLQRILAPLAEKFSLSVTVLGRGLSSGSELEYADPETLKNALRGRR